MKERQDRFISWNNFRIFPEERLFGKFGLYDIFQNTSLEEGWFNCRLRVDIPMVKKKYFDGILIEDQQKICDEFDLVKQYPELGSDILIQCERLLQRCTTQPTVENFVLATAFQEMVIVENCILQTE